MPCMRDSSHGSIMTFNVYLVRYVTYAAYNSFLVITFTLQLPMVTVIFVFTLVSVEVGRAPAVPMSHSGSGHGLNFSSDCSRL